MGRLPIGSPLFLAYQYLCRPPRDFSTDVGGTEKNRGLLPIAILRRHRALLFLSSCSLSHSPSNGPPPAQQAAGVATQAERIMHKVKSSRRGAACLIIAMSSAAMFAADPVFAQTRFKFSLDSRIEGPAAPFLVAIDKGYFKAEKLEVSIDPAASSAEVINRVAAGNYEMGVADINALIKFRDANPSNAIKAVFMVYNRPAYSIIGRRSRGVNAPNDLEGKKLGAPAADTSYAQWSIFAQVNGIDATKVKIENVGFPVREPMLQSGQVDAITGLSFSSFVNLKAMGVPANDLVVMLMADHGVDLYGNAIIVNPKFAADKPDAVKGFLRAFINGLKDTVKNPTRAVDSALERMDGAKKAVEIERLRMAIKDSILTPEVKAHGYGAIDDIRFAKAIDQIALGHAFKNSKPKPGDIFDASFLPPPSQRQAR
jgi:NitT/TauT family transport system substrate-binding protein